MDVVRTNSGLLDPWEIPFDGISLHRIIGEGAFGKVYSGELLKQFMEVAKGKESSQRNKDKKQQQMKKGVTVAVKMLQSTICLCQGVLLKTHLFIIFITMFDASKSRITLFKYFFLHGSTSSSKKKRGFTLFDNLSETNTI